MGRPLKALRTLPMVALLWLGATVAWAQEKGCIECHTERDNTPMHAVFNTPHAELGDGKDGTCQICHGVSQEHARNPDSIPPELSFGPRWPDATDERNGTCIDCHESRGRMLWAGSGHQREGLGCNDCHVSHHQADPALSRDQALELCGSCHQRQRAELLLPSRHPILEGKTACGDCHSPHGSLGEAALHQLSVNDNCLSCHQEKRGPFLWEHAPVAEDCSLCHRPHGSVNARLLTARGPALCQQCHAAAFHPSLPYGGEGTVAGLPNRNLVGKNCLNCHSQVHGSNHPSGARLTR